MKAYICWNEARNEGVIFLDRDDAKSAQTGKGHRKLGYTSIASIAEAFHESYGDDKCSLETIEIPDVQLKATARKGVKKDG